MKITVVPRNYICRMMIQDPKWYMDKWIISIFSSPYCCPNGAFSPVPAADNVCHLQFDDVTEKDILDEPVQHFNSDLAQKIKKFIENIQDDGRREMFIHCDAGVSRSGAVGILLNEYFNKFLTNNVEDAEFSSITTLKLWGTLRLLAFLRILCLRLITKCFSPIMTLIVMVK